MMFFIPPREVPKKQRLVKMWTRYEFTPGSSGNEYALGIVHFYTEDHYVNAVPLDAIERWEGGPQDLVIHLKKGEALHFTRAETFHDDSFEDTLYLAEDSFYDTGTLLTVFEAHYTELWVLVHGHR